MNLLVRIAGACLFMALWLAALAQGTALPGTVSLKIPHAFDASVARLEKAIEANRMPPPR